MSTALVGYTGFVGRSLLRKIDFDDRFNRSNIEEIGGKRYSFIVCAGAPAEKWSANQDPEQDRANVDRLMSCLANAEAQRFVLISTVDVYPDPVGVDEETPIDPKTNHPYGRHRYLLERFVSGQFPDHCVIRLPGLFGLGLKKNLVYDLLTSGASPYTHPDSVFQYYDMENLWRDIQAIIGTQLPLINVATEPIPAREIAQVCSVPADWPSQARPVAYDVQTQHAGRLGRRGPYLYTSAEVLAGLRAFVETRGVES